MYTGSFPVASPYCEGRMRFSGGYMTVSSSTYWFLFEKIKRGHGFVTAPHVTAPCGGKELRVTTQKGTG